jgi:hypothetical protein
VYQFPEFNNFNRWAAHSADPKDSDSYKKGSTLSGRHWTPALQAALIAQILISGRISASKPRSAAKALAGRRTPWLLTAWKGDP